MAKTFITAHIKLEDELWQRLGGYARNRDLTTAQLIRKVLTDWTEDQVWGHVAKNGNLYTVAEVRAARDMQRAFEAGWWAFAESNMEEGGKCSTPPQEVGKFLELLDRQAGRRYSGPRETDS